MARLCVLQQIREQQVVARDPDACLSRSPLEIDVWYVWCVPLDRHDKQRFEVQVFRPHDSVHLIPMTARYGANTTTEGGER